MYIYEMADPAGVGYGSAGQAARANSASTVFTNPAGMTRFEDPDLLVGGTGIYIHANFKPDRDNTVVGSDGQTSEFIGGGQFAYIRPLTDKLKFGISAQNYFGLMLDWSDQWVGRYNAVNVKLLAPQVQPTLAYKVNDWLSVGGGAGLTLGYLYDKVRIDTLNPNRGDGKLRLSDADFAVQGNLGIMIEPSARTRFGLRYLTETDLDFKDAPRISGVGAGFAQNPDTIDLGLKMPQSVMTSVYHQLNDKWSVLGSIGWDDFSSFGKIHVRVEGTDLNTTIDEDFRDVWHFGTGAEYRYSPKWTFTGGVSYDTSMMAGATRPIMIPLGAMYRYGLGFQYRKREDLTLGGGLSFLFEGSLPVKPGSGGLTGQASGKYSDKTSLSFLSFYVNWK
jgi:long-chain fatty acid transport protein